MFHGRQDSTGLQRGRHLLYSSSVGSGLHVAVDVACSLLACSLLACLASVPVKNTEPENRVGHACTRASSIILVRVRNVLA